MAWVPRAGCGGLPSGEPHRSTTSLWRIVARETPRLWRHCAGCGAARAFVSSGHFRVNANGRRLDVWLIHRCCECEATWNAPIHERFAPTALPPDELQDFLDNEPRRAWDCAFGHERFERLGVRVDAKVSFRIDVSERKPVYGESSSMIQIELAHPIHVRLDRLLASQLAISGSQVARCFDEGHIRIPEGRRLLRRPVRHGQRLQACGCLHPQRLADANWSAHPT